MEKNISKIRKTANVGLYGSIGVVLLTVIFHYCPYQVSPQSPLVARWMLISGVVLAVLAVVMSLMTIRKSIPQIRQKEQLEERVKDYAAYIRSLYLGTLSVTTVECLLIVLMTDNSLLMVTLLLVLLLFLAYPNMYKMKSDLGLLDEEMTTLFGDAYVADVKLDAEPDLETPSREEVAEDADEPKQ